MALAWNPCRKACAKGSNLISVVLAVLVLWCSVGQVLTRTPLGVHCPTASVQLVTVTAKDCCGKVIAVTKRKPKIGERDFLQCRCAEKVSSHQKADFDRVGPHVEMLPMSVFVLRIPLPVQTAPIEHAQTVQLPAVPSSPPVPPPSFC